MPRVTMMGRTLPRSPLLLCLGLLLFCYGGLARSRRQLRPRGWSDADVVLACRCNAHEWFCGDCFYGGIADFKAVSALRRWSRVIFGKIRTQRIRSPSSCSVELA